MKKSLLILSSLLGLFSAIVAQPTLTHALNSPMVGDVFITNITNAVPPGSAGASQTWNLSSMTMTSTSTSTATTAASTPSGSSFPSSNVALYDGSSYAYYQTSTGSWLNNGSVAGGVVFSYTNAEVMLNYPFTFGNSVVDAWGCNWSSGSINFIRFGTSTITADGHGTVITPAGTFSNVLRVHLIQSYKDSSTTFPLNLNYLNDQYLWYRPGTHYPVAGTYTISTSSGPSSSGFYLSNVVTGVKENENTIGAFEVFPNPAQNELNLNYTSVLSTEAELSVYNVTGQKVLENKININKGANEMKLNVSNLSAGVYYIQLQANGTLIKNDRFIINK
jgi:hypothetical protein